VTRIAKNPTPTPPLLIPTEAITFSPNTFEDFVDTTDEFGGDGNRFRTEIPLIFLETQQELGGGIPKGKKMILVKRLKASLINTSKDKDKDQSTTSRSLVESTMWIQKQELDSFESLKDPVSSTEFNLQQSTSATGVVSRVHAHISNCPKGWISSFSECGLETEIPQWNPAGPSSCCE
jgi:hypothetical protein